MRCAVLVEHAAFRQAMAYLLARDLRIELVEQAFTFEEARALVLERLEVIDVVVSELSLPDGEATDFLADLREAGADVPVLVLTSWGAHDSRDRALELGAAQVMGKESRIEEIFAAIRRLGGQEDG